jgi:hypothetical protein
MSYTGSISENRVSVPMPPVLRNLLAEEARKKAITVPALIRLKLFAFYDEEMRYGELRRMLDQRQGSGQ